MVNVLPWVTPLIKPNTQDHISWTRPPRNHFAVSTVEKHLLFLKRRHSNKFRPYSITISVFLTQNSNNLLLETLSLIADGSRISVQKYFTTLYSAGHFIQACQTTCHDFFLNHLYWPKMTSLSTLNRFVENNLVPS